VAVTLSGSTCRLYLNGAQVGTSSAITLKPSSLGNTTLNYLGRSQWAADSYFNGALDDLRIYSRALTGSEISILQTPLTAPQNVVATPGPLNIALSWSAVAGASRYAVQGATSGGGPYAVLAANLSSPSFTHSGLSFGTTYRYVIVPGNFADDGPASDEVSATPESALVSAAERTAPLLVIDQIGSGEGPTATLTSAPSVVGHTYQLQSCDDLAAGEWANIGDPIAGNGAALEFIAPYDPAEPRGFYRIVITR
jgi:hypothetical protein